jgi:hypothetical protein
LSAVLDSRLRVPGRRSLEHLSRRQRELVAAMSAATVDGYRQVYGRYPTTVYEIWEGRTLMAVECTGDVDPP